MPEKYSARARRRAFLAISSLAAKISLAAAAAASLGAAYALSSCARKAPVVRAAATPGATSAQGSSPRTIGDVPPPPSPKAVAPLAASVRAFGLGTPSTPRVAEDFSLGPLQSFKPAEGAEAAVFAVARDFMDGLAAGKLDKGLLLPEARDALALLLEPVAQRSAKSETASSAAEARGDVPNYRLGAIVIRGEDASLKVRLSSAKIPSDPAKAIREEGLLSLRKVGDAWYVEALALGLPVSGALAFDPDAPERSK
jgi:hypothetical protein